MNKYAITAFATLLFSGTTVAAGGSGIDPYNYNLCKARGIAAVGVVTDAIEKKEPVEATLNRLKPPTPMDVKLAILADDYIKAGFAASNDAELDDLKQFLAGVCYQSVKAP